MSFMERRTIKIGHNGAFGATVLDDGRVQFRFWAPALRNVVLVIEGRDPLR
jgi:1,4-alpha-glucan branching enzyme